MSDDPFAVCWFTTAPNGEPPAVGEVREDQAAILAAMERELDGVLHRLETLVDPGEQRPLDRLAYQQARGELESYRDTVKAQIKAQQARVRAAARATR
jgi:hypothetical protein